MDFKLRQYQVEAIDAIEGNILFGEKNIILKATTSFGKSSVIAGLCERFNDKSISIIVNIEPLIDQIAVFLKLLNIDYSILKAGRESEFRASSRVHLIMSQTLYARLDKLDIKSDICIIDERHIEYDTKRTGDVLKHITPDVIIGMTATPYNQAGFALANAEIVETADTNWLTEQGYLSKVNYYVPRWAEKVDYSSVSKSGVDYNLSSLDSIINSKSNISKIVKAMNDMKCKDKKTLVFCTTIDQCNLIAEALSKDGYSAKAYHSDNSKNENEYILDSFKNNTKLFANTSENKTLFDENELSVDKDAVKCLISVSKLTTGFSVNDIDIGVSLRPSKVRSLVEQIIGRVRRTSNSLDELLSKYSNVKGKKIAFVCSAYNEKTKIKTQLKQLKASHIDVFEYKSEPDEYDIVECNVRPNKEYGEYLDLAQNINTHGFPEETYYAPEFTGFHTQDKQNLEEATKDLKMDHLMATIGSDKPECITRDGYNIKIEQIKKDSTKLTNLTIRQLSNKLEVEMDPTTIISVTCVLFDKMHCSGDYVDKFGKQVRGYTTNKGKDVVNFLNPRSIGWIAEDWVKQLELENAFYKRKYIKALRTRCKTLLLQKGSIYAIKYFLQFLLEGDAEEKNRNNSEEEEASYSVQIEDSSGNIEVHIDDCDIPF